ncbi:MAG: dihydrolipoamide acetyltransferase [Proteobacteria bacterium]|nr:dihydrolipoamide acetyltransferase [Pseudomonadota bacterium]
MRISTVARAAAFSALLLASTALAQDEGGLSDGDSAAAEPELPDAAATERSFNRELRTVEQDVTRLKERVFRSKATLQLLKELVVEGASLGSRVVIHHVNEMGPSYTMESIQYFLDGRNVYNNADFEDGLDHLRDMKVHEQSVPPGPHTLQVQYSLRGNGFGIFSYLRTYSFKVQSSFEFEVDDGMATSVRVIADEHKGLTRTFMDRPNVKYMPDTQPIRSE